MIDSFYLFINHSSTFVIPVRLFCLCKLYVSINLFQILTPFLLRRLKSDVDLTIPPKKEVYVYAPLTEKQQSFYKSTLDRTILDMLDKQKVHIQNFIFVDQCKQHCSRGNSPRSLIQQIKQLRIDCLTATVILFHVQINTESLKTNIKFKNLKF